MSIDFTYQLLGLIGLNLIALVGFLLAELNLGELLRRTRRTATQSSAVADEPLAELIREMERLDSTSADGMGSPSAARSCRKPPSGGTLRQDRSARSSLFRSFSTMARGLTSWLSGGGRSAEQVSGEVGR